MTEVLFTRKQAAAILQVTSRTIMRYERRGMIKPSLYVAGRPRYTMEAIQAAVTERKITTNPLNN
jgi:predicted site-specific integrase-resolvase